MSAPWVVRPYADGDEVRVVELFREVFGRPMTTRHYLWKLCDTPLRVDAATAWLADSGDRIVGQYAGTPMRFQFEGEVVQALHGCDDMTAPDYRRQGVLTALGTSAREAWTSGGVTLVTGLHYGGWGTRRHVLDWREQFRSLQLWRPLRLDRVIRRFVPLPFVGDHVASVVDRVWKRMTTRSAGSAATDVSIAPVSRPGPEFDSLWDRIGCEYESLVVRDRAWVTYRFADAPHADYRILLATRGDAPLGYIVFRILVDGARASGFIVDLFTAPRDAATRAELVRSAVDVLEEAGADTVRAFVSEGTRLSREFRRLGFFRRKGHFDVSIIPLDAARDYSSLSDPDRWFAMPGDFDVW